MSETLGSRVRAARAALRMSQRAFAQALGVSFGAVQSWERDRTSPNGEALAAMCRLGFDGHWLVMGEGEPWRAGREPAEGSGASSSPSVRAASDPAVWSQLRDLERTPLGEILLLSRRGMQEHLWRVLQIVFEGPAEGMAEREIFKELADRTGDQGLSSADIAADCRLLEAEQLLERIDASSGRRWRLVDAAALQPGQHVDRLQAVREAIHVLCNTVAPGLARADRRAYLTNAVVYVPDGQAFIAQLRDVVIGHIRSTEVERGEAVHLVVGAAEEVD